MWRAGFLVLLLLAGCAAQRPLVIAHRGASGYLPEHTLEAYGRAIDLGADYIEPDLVATRDGVLIARHENELSDTTDVAFKFPERRSTKTIDGREVSGWFSEDFTLAEIRNLRAKERLPFRRQDSNGLFAIPTFAEVLELAARKGAERGRPVGVYPETKHPSHFAGLGLPLEEPLVAALTAAGLNRAGAPVFIQSFEVANLQRLRTMTPLPLIQLLGGPRDQPHDVAAAGGATTYGDMASDRGLAAIALYAKGIGPPKELIVPRAQDGQPSQPTDLVVRAHRAGLLVHPYTFRSDKEFLAPAYGGDPTAEYCRFYRLGVDGVFSDFPDTALQAVRESCPM
jgi:glycerophosphoryl diester phosphodiesterase